MLPLILSAGIFAGGAAPGETNNAATADNFISPPPVTIETARGFYNAGTEKLRAKKWDDAETLLESSLAKQDERVQSAAVFNLGHVRFAQGVEELKKSPLGAAARSRAATDAGTGAISQATAALAGNDIPQMVDAYMAGRGKRFSERWSNTAKRCSNGGGRWMISKARRS